MSFLNTAILLGLFAASIPIIIHLLTRSRTRTISFSSLFFLKSLEEKNLRRLKWRQLLLLILRTLVIAMLVLAFARPAIRTASTAFANAKTSAVLLVDNSYSMQLASPNARSLLNEATNIANDILDNFQAGDQIILMSLDDTSQFSAISHSPELVREKLSDIDLTFKDLDYPSVLARAEDRLSTLENINKELYVLSDFQANDWQTIDSLKNNNIKRFAVTLKGHQRNNLAIAHLQLMTTILEPGKTAEIEAKIINTTDQKQENRLISLYMDNTRVAQSVVSLEPLTEINHLFKINLTRTGWNSIRCELEDDELLSDNTRFLSIFVPPNQRVAIIADPGADLHFLSMALEANTGNNSLIEWVRWSPAEAEAKLLRDIDVVVLYDLTQIELTLLDRLQDFKNSGKGLWLICGPQVNIDRYNQDFNPVFSIPRFRSRLVLEESIAVGTIDLSHPIFQGVFENNTESIERPRVRFAVQTQPLAGTIPIIDYSTGDAYLFEVQQKQGKLLVMTSPLQPQYNELVYRPLFAPLINRSIYYLAISSDQSETNLDIGQPIQHRLNLAQLKSDLRIVRPDGNQDQVQPELQAAYAWIRYPFTDIPGTFTLRDENEIYKIWSVNIDANESDNRMVSKDIIKNKLKMQFLNQQNLVNTIAESRYGQEFWKPLVLLVLILLVVEMVLAFQRNEVKIRE